MAKKTEEKKLNLEETLSSLNKQFGKNTVIDFMCRVAKSFI